MLNRRLQKLLVGEVPEPEGKRAAKMEWDFDCNGETFLNFERLTLSFFQLVDLWTDVIDADVYAEFLGTCERHHLRGE